MSGERLDAAVRRLVTEPLGMASTGYGPVAAETAVAYGHGDDIEQAMIRDGEPYPVTIERTVPARFRTDWVRGEVSDGNAFHAMHGISGHAGLFSTLDDLARFGAALLDESPVWSRAVLDDFLTPGPDGQAIGFWWQPATGGPAYGHPGFTGAQVPGRPGRSLGGGPALEPAARHGPGGAGAAGHRAGLAGIPGCDRVHA